MAREFAKALYNSKSWLKCRASFIADRTAIDGGMCQRCGVELGYIVHHKDWLTPENINDPDIALNHSNLEYVCHLCHNKIDGEEENAQYRFDSEGQLIPI
jgi:DNA-directed RNA polymerase subunit RPC12/RpoP